LIAAAVLAGFFLLATIVAAFCSVLPRRHTIEQAELALASRKQAAWFEPKLLAGAIQASRGIGWRRSEWNDLHSNRRATASGIASLLAPLDDFHPRGRLDRSRVTSARGQEPTPAPAVEVQISGGLCHD